MTAVHRLIDDLAQHGARLQLRGDHLQLIERRGSPAPDTLVIQATRLKPQLIRLLRSHKPPPAGVVPATNATPPTLALALQQLAYLPAAVRGGLALLDPERPLGGEAERWRQVVADAWLFANKWAEHAIGFGRGWTVQELFGIHLGPHGSTDEQAGLIIRLRGSPVLMLNQFQATIRAPDGSLRRLGRRD